MTASSSFSLSWEKVMELLVLAKMNEVSFVICWETMWHMASKVPEEFGNWADMSVYKVIKSFNYGISFLISEFFFDVGVTS